MPNALTTSEKNKLKMMWNYQGDWEPLAKFANVVGKKSIARFLELGLVDEKASDVYGTVYQINEKGCQIFE